VLDHLSLTLNNKYDIYMLDSQGHGLSDPFTSGDTGETLMKDVVEFVKVMEFQKPILMGHSLGTATVMRIGADHPEIARAIIMLDPILKNRTTGQWAAPNRSTKIQTKPQPETPAAGIQTTIYQ
jgi:pimeloyl-ACP methyl ester carboxylesterase